MSSKKILVKVSIDEEVTKKLIEEAAREVRTKSSMMEKILRDRYKLSWEGQGDKNAER